MACYSPLRAWQLESGEVVFCERGDVLRDLVLPCGQCVGCLLERSRQWAMRCMHESQLHLDNSFVTLTYGDEHLPENASLRYRDFQLFMKRLRKTGVKARFFMCGEYGDQYGRPHFHACLFGVDFPDRVLFRKMASGCNLYTSRVLASLWPFGFCSIGDVTFESAAYVARYVIKKMLPKVERLGIVDMSTGELQLKASEFVHMSLKPGIGHDWFLKYRLDVFENDYVIVKGRKCKPPIYYSKLLSVIDPDSAEFMELARYRKSFACELDNSPARLAVREQVARAALAFKVRTLE